MRVTFAAIALLALASAACVPLRAQTPLPVQTPGDYDRPVSWKTLLPNVGHDQKDIWTSPLRIRNRHYLWPTLAVLGATAGLIALDSKDAPWFKNNTAFNGFNRAFSGSTTQWSTLAVPVLMYSAGLVRKDRKMKSTAMLIGEAVGDSEILTTILKDATNRTRPAAIGTGQSYSDTWFDSKGSFLRGNGSFPSGHAIAAFSVATVISRRYGHHKWVPFVAYGLAGAVGFSRISLSAHFISDVFAGGVLGYSISRFAVLHD